MVTAVATVYQIASGRNRAALRALVGTQYRRVLTSDRHGVYSHLAEGRHQWCWSHLRRDFQAMVDRNNAGSAIGQELLAMSGQMLRWWKRVRDGTLTKVRFAGRLHAQREFRVRFRAVLGGGGVLLRQDSGNVPRTVARRGVDVFFAFVDGVEPTNNAAKRALRHGVLWRKMSHGPKSVKGSEYLACIWSVVETCRKQGRGVGFSDGLHGLSRPRAQSAVVVSPARFRSGRLTLKWAVSDHYKCMPIFIWLPKITKK